MQSKIRYLALSIGRVDDAYVRWRENTIITANLISDKYGTYTAVTAFVNYHSLDH